MERLQYLAAEPPKLSVQFPNDLMTTRTTTTHSNIITNTK